MSEERNLPQIELEQFNGMEYTSPAEKQEVREMLGIRERMEEIFQADPHVLRWQSQPEDDYMLNRFADYDLEGQRRVDLTRSSFDQADGSTILLQKMSIMDYNYGRRRLDEIRRVDEDSPEEARVLAIEQSANYKPHITVFNYHEMPRKRSYRNERYIPTESKNSYPVVGGRDISDAELTEFHGYLNQAEQSAVARREQVQARRARRANNTAQ